MTLTVTDDRGGKDTETKNVVATAPANHPFASDAFSRTRPAGWARPTSAERGHSTADPAVSRSESGVGIWKLPTAGASRTGYLGVRRCGTAPT